jgi:FkbM family methyltransferase
VNYKWESTETYNIVTYEVDGITNWYWRPGDWGGFMYPAKEWYKIRDTVLKYTPERDVIVQAGGCCGMYPRLWSKYFRIVHTFEPVDNNFEVLCKNCPDHIIKHRCALGDSNDPVIMKGGAEIISQGKNVKNVGMYWVDKKVEKGIYQLMLDQLQLPKLDAMQLDVEGYEIHVLRGAIETIKRCSPTICIETYNDEVKDFLSSLGYRVVERAGEESWAYPGDTVLVRQ